MPVVPAGVVGMSNGRGSIVGFLAGAALLVVAAGAAAQPSVYAFGSPAGGSLVEQTVERPASPLAVEVTTGSGLTATWAQAVPGVLRARASCSGSVSQYQNSRGGASFVDYFRLTRPGLPDNAPGHFLYQYYLSGVMRVSASTSTSYATVTVFGNSTYYGNNAGMLSFGLDPVNGGAYLYALGGEVGGGGYPWNNMFAGPGGTMKVYGRVPAPTAGSYTIYVRFPVSFLFRDFPCNRGAAPDDFSNRLSFGLQTMATLAAASDFSSTFQFTSQNPIVPSPDDARLPVDGWTFTSGSGDIVLPSPLGVACATGTGEAFFRVTDGLVENLDALGAGEVPASGRPASGFADGWFSLDITGLQPGGQTELIVTVPTDQEVGTNWWYPTATGWAYVRVTHDDGDGTLKIALTDGLRGDSTGADGTIHFVGGLSPASAPVPVWLAGFTAVARGGGVDLAWRAEGADPSALALTARRDGAAWSVPFTARDDGAYAARDEAAALAGGGRVAYTLAHAGQVLAVREVDLPSPGRLATLHAARPNPFNPRTTLRFALARPARAALAVYDLQGRLVRALLDADLPAGETTVAWDGLDARGDAAASGVYVVRLEAGGETAARKVVLAR